MISFTKMHGLGNDFVVVNCLGADAPDRAIDAAVARAMCDRRRGIGADGVLLIEPAVDADFAMRVLNADGTEPEMCGNGIRCVCKYAVEQGICDAQPMRVQTGRGVLELDWVRDSAGRVASVTVDMGAATFGPSAVGAEIAQLESVDEAAVRLRVGGDTVDAVAVSMGNPHIVVFVDDVAAVDLQRLGPAIETHAAFPKRTNVHVVQVHNRDQVTMRTWERGCGITLACGTGACAVCAAGVVTQRTRESITAHLPGGDLQLCFENANSHVFITGSAEVVYSGQWSGCSTREAAVVGA